MSKVYVLPTRMNKEGRIQIPKLVREEMGWTADDQYSISMSENEDKIVIKRVAEATGSPSQTEE